MTNDFEYIYYLPLEIRKAINSAASFTVQVTGVGLSTYKPSEPALTDIKEIVDQEKELEGYLSLQQAMQTGNH